MASNNNDYNKYIHYAIIVALGFLTFSLILFVQWAFSITFNKDEIERTLWSVLGLGGIAISGAAALSLNKNRTNKK